MRIYYPYNEKLPRKKAHDVYLFKECAAFAKRGHEVTLLCGRGTLEDAPLFAHYAEKPSFCVKRLPMLRGRISWNLPFFYATQRVIERDSPDVVILSVFKQGKYHLKRKHPGVFYIYEVHELSWYPGFPVTERVEEEREFLERADLVVVTTGALRDILMNSPYQLTVPIEVIPLAVDAHPLPPPQPTSQLVVGYVGQLYEGQGVPLLLRAIQRVAGIRLKVVGGKPEEIERLKGFEKTTFLGFRSPSQLESVLGDVGVFVAPFEGVGRMPYVAHTKLAEYAVWGRPVVAPDFPLVREHFPMGALFFTPGDEEDLARKLALLVDHELRSKLQAEIRTLAGCFSWEERMRKYERVLTRAQKHDCG